MVKISSSYLFFLIICVFVSPESLAGMYKCVDKNEGVTYSQTPCKTGQKNEKVTVQKTVVTVMEDCKYAGKFAKIVIKKMRSGDSVHKTLNSYGGIYSISKNTLGVINHVYSYELTPKIPEARIVNLSILKCNTKAFGNFICENLPDDFQASINACDEEQQKDMMLQEAKKDLRPNKYPEVYVSDDEKNERILEMKKVEQLQLNQRKQKKIETCKKSYDSKIEAVNLKMRHEHSSSQGNLYRKQRRELQNSMYIKCR